MGRVVSPTPTPLSSGRVVPALVTSYDMHGRAVGLFYTQPTGHRDIDGERKKKKKKKNCQKIPHPICGWNTISLVQYCIIRVFPTRMVYLKHDI